ncbi:hypothetical protein Droror1_Dr00014808 [Drosera rotundifolia]
MGIMSAAEVRKKAIEVGFMGYEIESKARRGGGGSAGGGECCEEKVDLKMGKRNVRRSDQGLQSKAEEFIVEDDEDVVMELYGTAAMQLGEFVVNDKMVPW